jgi:exosortase/archaeosortase family protein
MQIFFWPTNFYKLTLLAPNFMPYTKNNLATVGIFVVFMFILYHRKELINLKSYPFKALQTILLALFTVLMLVLYYIARYFTKRGFIANYYVAVIFISSILLLYVLTLAVTVFGARCLLDFIRQFKKTILIFVGGGVLVYFAILSTQQLWPYFSIGVGKIIFTTFQIFYSHVQLIQNPTGPILTVGGFSAGIGAPCSGIDSLLMFSGLFILIFVLDYKRLNKKIMIVMFPIGLAGTYIINILRIFLLFLIGVYISPSFAVGLFHQNIGWILFIAYFFVFYLFASKRIYLDLKNIKQRRR